MKKQFYIFLLSVLFSVLCNYTHAQCTWTTLGAGAASTASLTSYNDIALSPTDVPYISYSDPAASNALTVKSYSGTTWQAVGSLSTFTNASYTSIAFNGAIPYVAFADGTSSSKATVKMYNAGTWTTVGTAVSTSTASFISMAIYGGVPYVVYVDGSNGNRATVKTYTAGAWTALGAAVSTSSASYTSLSIDNSGTPYVIYHDIANGNLATVKKYSGGSWLAVGTGTVSAGAVTETCIDVSYNNIPYIAYNTGSYVCTIKTFTAGAWQSVGSGTVSNVYQALTLAVDPIGTPYISYYDLIASYRASVMKYDGLAWGYVGGSSGISIGGSSYNTLAINSTGYPYVTYTDGSSGTYVKKLGSTVIITTQPAPVTVCVGTNATIAVTTNTTAGLTYQWQVNTGSGFTNINNGPVYNGVTTQALLVLNSSIGYSGYQYRCIINDGCTNILSNAAILTVNPLPVITVNSATLCTGGSAVLNATGGVTYLWNTGATTQNIAVTPTINTVYSVTGTNAFACSANASSTVTVISSKTISGNVTSSIGAVSGNVILYKYKPMLSKWDSVAFAPFSSIYSFGVMDSSSYVIKAVPTATNVQITYGTSAISWKGATTLTHGCSSNSTQNITVIPLTPVTGGTGLLSGTIREGQGFGQKPNSTSGVLSPGQPIKGIIVKGGKNPGGSMFAQTVTAADGTYTLSGLPNNAVGQSYFILVDIPGLDTNQTYHKIIVANDQYTNLDFTVDSAKINPTLPVGIDAVNAFGDQLKLYPNPAKNKVNLEYSLSVQSTVHIEILDIVGRSVKVILPDTQQNPDRYLLSSSLDELKPGIYFIKIKINTAETLYKLIVTD